MPDFRLEGVFPALVTPFKKNEDIDEEALKNLINSIIDHVDGFVPCGTTGEFPYLSFEERKKIYDIVIDEVNGKKPIIAGTGANSARHTIELTRYAKDAGADACLVVNPYFLHPSDKGVHQFFWKVANSCDVPIIMYNIPMTTDSYIPRRVIEDLANIDNIVGLKDSSGNLTYTLEILEKVRDKIDVVIGHDEVVLPALASGCSGMILASAQVFPDIWQRVYKAVKENDLKTARELQMSVQKLSRIFCRHGGPVPVKAALRMMGIKCGKARAPLKEGGVLIHEDREEIRLELEKIGKIKPKEFDVKPSIEPIENSFEDIGLNKDKIQDSQLAIARVTAGEGREMVQIDLVAGRKTSALGQAFATQLTHPRHGYEALTTILEPNLTVRPSSLIIPAVELKNLRQANMIYGPTQSAVAKAIVDNIEQGIIPRDAVDDYLMVLKIFVHPSALDRQLLYENNYRAVNQAIKIVFQGKEGGE